MYVCDSKKIVSSSLVPSQNVNLPTFKIDGIISIYQTCALVPNEYYS